MKIEILREVLNIVCCPACCSGLSLSDVGTVVCSRCGVSYSIVNGILCLLPARESQQKEEKKLREAVAKEHGAADSERIMSAIIQHHCVPVMSRRASQFRSKIKDNEWIIDLGCGTAYYWRSALIGGKLLLLDFVLDNLLSAQKLLKGQPNIFYVQADATCLPIRSNAITGLWSVQVTQHFPQEVMDEFIKSLERVLKGTYLVEIYNLNPSKWVRWVYAVRKRKFHLKGMQGLVLINKLDGKELVNLWRPFVKSGRMWIDYSEIFFHPDLRLRSQNHFVLFCENILNKWKWFASFFSRQISIHIDCLK